MALSDPHSFADDAQPSTRDFALSLRLDFDARRVEGEVHLHLDRPAEGVLDLDTNGLEIRAVEDAHGPVAHDLAPADPIKGRRLRLALKGDAVRIRFAASETASALQWLAPAQTSGPHPFMFTQCQPIHARSIFPCQDTPRVRARYTAEIDAPRALVAVMAAGHAGREERGDRAITRFEMAQPIPSYLFAFAVGDLAARELGPRSVVYAEPAELERAAHEFAGVNAMIERAEQLFGPYDWERFDLLVMPRSFPYGGMENPRLTFLTPTIIAGDRSMVNVVAHELAHSWTGNLVTNASMNDFWLNEGFTTYAERRIIETLEGEEVATLHAAVGFEHLKEELGRFGADSPFTRLRTELEGVDPDQVYSSVPYEKGYLFLRAIEAEIGRPAFDAFLQSYIARFRFRSIDTDAFLEHLRGAVNDIDDRLDLAAWLFDAGLPEDAPRPRSNRLDAARAAARRLAAGEPIDTAGFVPQEWQILLSALPRGLSSAQVEAIDRAHGLSRSNNAEIQVAFLALAAGARDERQWPAIEAALHRYGRMKFLRQLYTALREGGPTSLAFARRVFEGARPSYHPLAANVVAGILSAEPKA